jgi:hypothetical protein
MNEEKNEEELQRYKYIGYIQDFPLDQNKYELSIDLLLKLAREAVRKHDYYNAIRYLNMILIKNPKNYTAMFYKKQVVRVLEQMKRSRDLTKTA